MGIATPPPPPHLIIGPPKPVSSLQTPTTTSTSMSHGFHHHHHHHQGGIFGFSSDVFDRSAAPSTTTTIPGNAGQNEHVAQQSRREKLRVQEFDPAAAAAAGHAQLVSIDDDSGDGDGQGGGQEASMYATAAGGAGHAAAGSMLSEMFNFAGAGPSGGDLLGYRQLSAMRPAAPPMAAFGAGDWYAGSSNKPQHQHQQQQQQQQALHHHPVLTADSAMQLFLMNPPPPPPPHHHQHTRSPSPPPPPPPQPEQHTQTLHHHQALIQAFGDSSASSFGGGQGLSLSLSSSLQQFEMAKAAEELRVRDAAMLYYNQQQQQQQQQQQLHHLQLEGHGQVLGPPQAAQLGFGPAGVAAVLRSSKYARAAQELLEEFCSIGRGQFRSGRIGRANNPNPNPNPKSGGNSGASSSAAAAAAAAASTSSSKEAPPLSPAERFEHQRKKAKLISMLDEVERRYNHYCEQMQMVVNSFDSVMGFGAATPYTALAQKAMSRHFRCLKDAIAAQLRQACELLGEKDAGGGSGLTKGETPRLRILDQTLRQQRAFHHMGMMEQEAWRPQRGLPERSVNVLRAWLFEHFLHPYPSDADKHFLARQTGLSRNQVSNWFINARVRLWKPMVEEMYQQEAKDHDDDDEDDEAAAAAADAASSLSPPSSSGVGGVSGVPPKSEQHPGGPPAPGPQNAPQAPQQLSTSSAVADMAHAGLYSGRYAAAAMHALRFGAAGDVSLTLGLRHGAGGGGGSDAGGGGDGGGGGGGGGRFGAVREFGG